MFEPTYETDLVLTSFGREPTKIQDVHEVSKEVQQLLNEKSREGFDFIHSIPLISKNRPSSLTSGDINSAETYCVILVFRERELIDEEDETA